MSRKYFIKYNEIIFFIKQKSSVQFKIVANLLIFG
jgi:hypothetical protein